MATDSLAAPILAGLAAGIALVMFFALIFNSVTPMINPINLPQDSIPLPQIMMIDDRGSKYAGNMTTFSWGIEGLLFIANISDAFGHSEDNGETTISLENGSIVNFLARDYYDSNATCLTYRLPVTVYVYHYPSNDFEGILGEIDGAGKSNHTSFVVDRLDEGDYYLRVDHQNQEKGGGSISFYFKVRIT